MEILKFPDIFLFQKTKEVTVFGEELLILLDGMYDVMKKNRGIGLAANQVGLPFRMFVMDGPLGRINLINPTISNQSKVPANIKEGCLSAPGEFIVVPSRTKWITVEYKDEKGNSQKITFHGIHSICASHEIEHLNGDSFMQNKSISKRIRNELAKKWDIG